MDLNVGQKQMNQVFNGLIITCPNGGGLFLINEGRVRRIDNSNCTGLDVRADAVLLGLQPETLCLTGGVSWELSGNAVGFDDIHDVRFGDDHCYLVGTKGNEIIKLDVAGNEVQRWVFAGEDDSWHINCIELVDGRLVFSAFGNFRRHREYKGATKGAGFVQDVESGKLLIDNLSQPHSLTVNGGHLLIANSECKELREYTAQGELLRVAVLDGYTRGIYASDDVIYVGLSCSRNIENAGLKSAVVVALHRDTWQEVGRVSVPAKEIYAIKGISDNNVLVNALVGLSESANLRLQDSVKRCEAALAEAKAQHSQDFADCQLVLDSERNRLNSLLGAADAEVQRLQDVLGVTEQRLSATTESYQQTVAMNDQRILELELCHDELHRVRNQLDRVLNSRSLRLTAPLRGGASVARKLYDRGGRVLRYIAGNPRSIPNALVHFRVHGIRGGLRRLREVASPTAVPVLPVRNAVRFDLKAGGEAVILTTQHCLFVAELIARQLSRIGVRSQIVFEKPTQGFVQAPHFVICPQMFAELPELYVAFQMEQTVSSRWLTERYMSMLEHSFAVFEYSQLNLGYFTSNGLSYRQMYFMPIGYLNDYPANRPMRAPEKEYDVLFYGDATNERRKAFIAQIEQKYRVKVIGNLFGEALYEELRKAKVLINIHYYEGALLETTRIYESLSLDCLIVSESSVDIDEHQNLANIVDFVDIGDADAMVERLDYWLADAQRREDKVQHNRQLLQHQPNWFEYFFQRFLLATENIDFDTFYRLAGHNIQFKGDFVCLGLPESVERRKDFMADNRYGIEYFPGLRHELGWVGCGMSYKFIMRKAKELRLPHITVCEDDVEFLDGWEAKYQTVLGHLVENAGVWDVFSGFIADLHADTKVLELTEVDDLEIVHIDHMVSAVLNVYNAGFYDAILRWDETNHDVHINAIDRYMENQEHIRVFTVHPFLVGHKEEQHSTLWGFQNSRYNALIEQSTSMLGERIEKYKNGEADRAAGDAEILAK